MYDRTFWQDHVTLPPNCYNIVDNGDGTYAITPVGEIVQQGTPQDQQHFNNAEAGMVDSHLSIGLLLNFARQNQWEIEHGSELLTNSHKFPFNNSEASIPLTAVKEGGDYVVLTDIAAANGNVGEIVISDKLSNGFKMAYTGSAAVVTINYIVIGGYLK